MGHPQFYDTEMTSSATVSAEVALATIYRTRPLVIACCSASKAMPSRASFVPLVGETRACAISRWRKILDAAEPDLPAGLLYRGRAFLVVRDAASRVGADLAIISAGLGLVLSGTPVPAYDLTIERGPGALARGIEDWEPRAWWCAIRDNRFAVPMMREAAARQSILIALTRSYARLLADEIERLAPHADRVRIFGDGLARVLPKAIQPCLMPYDARLDAIGQRGTRGDFAARALADFVDQIGIGPSCSHDAVRVRARLASAERPQIVANSRTDDETLAAEIRKMRRQQTGISSLHILRRLRHELGLACSEARLRRLLAADRAQY